MPSGKTQLTDERDKYRNAEVSRAKTARLFEESGMVDEASKQWGFAADNANYIASLAAMYPTVALDPLMPIITGSTSSSVRSSVSRALGRAAYYHARSLSLLQGPPPVSTTTLGPVLHPYPLPALPTPNSPEANSTPSTPEAAAQADKDEQSNTTWLLAIAGAALLIGYKVLGG